MSTDIHAHFEIKVGNRWLHYSKPHLERNYQLFAKMANVRNYDEVEPISMPKGLPYDISKVTELENKWWDSDGHSHSWFNAQEIKEIIEYHEEIIGEENIYKVYLDQWNYLNGNSWDSFEQYREDYLPEVQDIRLVFWFDN
uniref:Uncharacterized protein n=1 Tax=viral metagenome TaxID=1070528 RepID=A0A6H1ZCY1_9ZZZZ